MAFQAGLSRKWYNAGARAGRSGRYADMYAAWKAWHVSITSKRSRWHPETHPGGYATAKESFFQGYHDGSLLARVEAGYTLHPRLKTTRNNQSFRSLADIKAANKRLGHHFFDRETTRAFKTKYYPGVYGGRYFVTYEGSLKEYKVRRARDDGSVETAAAGFNDLQAARDHARSLAGRGNPPLPAGWIKGRAMRFIRDVAGGLAVQIRR